MQAPVSSITKLLVLLAFVPFIVGLSTELNKTALVWHIRIVDFLDLVLMAPFYILLLMKIRGYILSQNQPPFVGFVSFVLSGTFIYGHAMHMTANAIDTYSFEIRNYRAVVPQDMYELIHFLDEQLGHYLIFVSLIMLFLLYSYAEVIGKKIVDQSKSSKTLLYCSAFVFGLQLTVSAIEAQITTLYTIAVFLSIISIFLIIKGTEQPPNKLRLPPYPIVSFFMIVLFTSLLIVPIYYFTIGDFIQPSHM